MYELSNTQPRSLSPGAMTSGTWGGGTITDMLSTQMTLEQNLKDTGQKTRPVSVWAKSSPSGGYCSAVSLRQKLKNQ